MKITGRHSFTLQAIVVAGCFVVLSVPLLRSQTPPDDETSCRDFVQSFYDWYQNHSWQDVVKRKPPVLSTNLRRLLIKEEKEQESCGCIDHLDADPFLNSQDPEGRYVVTNVAIASGKCDARVEGSGQVRSELMKTEKGWVFVNFRYSFYSEDRHTKRLPDDDLLHMLSR